MVYILSNGKIELVDRVDYVSHGNNYRLALVTISGDLVIKCDAQSVIDLLEPIALNARASLGQIEPGHIRKAK